MNPARAPRARRSDARLLAVDAGTGQHADLQVADLPTLLRPGDLLVVNDAATLPASLSGTVQDGRGGCAEVELRLAGMAPPPTAHGSAGAEHDSFWAVLFGAGDWRTPTEQRPEPPPLAVGDRVRLTGSLAAEVLAVSPLSPRLLRVGFTLRGAALWAALYAHGRPVQYSYLHEELALWSVQTVYGGRPWAAEMPSAGRPLSWEILTRLRRAGVELAWLTHAAGLSSTGEAALDAELPLPERYEIPDTTARLLAITRRRGGRVIAVGTTVVRALEGAAQAAAERADGTLLLPSGVTELVLTAHSRLRIVDAILTGIHSPQESHFRLLAAFCPLDRLRQSWEHAVRAGYLCHEFGDLSLIAPDLGLALADGRGAGRS
jgi:S-adenosylmethionine:tRNA ribosyltransferase-isomerase